jgi:hypothetical protein
MEDKDFDYKAADQRARKFFKWFFGGAFALIFVLVLVFLLTGSPVGKAHLGSVVSDFQKNGWIFLGH